MMKEDEFIGKFVTQHYTIVKQYIDTEVPQIKLYYTKYSPQNPKYSIIIVHGFGEHSSRFKSVADFFAKNEFEVLMVDMRGFGHSGGARGCAEIRELENDIIILLSKAKHNLPLFIYAHSLGGLVTIKLLLQRSTINISGCVITSPLLGLSKNLNFNWFKKKFVHCFGNHLSDFVVNAQVNPTALTKKTKFIHTIFEDRLILPFLSVKMAKHIFDAIDYVQKKSNQFRYPVIVFHGKLDTLTDPELSNKFVTQKARPYKEFHLFPNGYHELQHDDQKDDLLKLSLEFIKKIPNPKNYGMVRVHCIPKPKPNKRGFIKIIFVIVVLLIILKKLKALRK